MQSYATTCISIPAKGGVAVGEGVLAKQTLQSPASPAGSLKICLPFLGVAERARKEHFREPLRESQMTVPETPSPEPPTRGAPVSDSTVAAL